MAFQDVSLPGRCDVCGADANVVVASSMLGAISFAYCENCWNAGAEPYGALVEYIACAGHWPNDINEKYQGRVRSILSYFGKSEEEFAQDVESAILRDNQIPI